MPVEYEPFSGRWRSDPYPVYRELRDHAPVHYAPESDCWCVSRYDDVLHVLKNPELFSSRAMFDVLMNGGSPDPPPLNWAAIKFLARYAVQVRLNPLDFNRARNLIASDPPVHGPLRALVNRGFTPRQIKSWEKRVQRVVDARMAELRSRADFDVVSDLAIPVPVTVIAELLGVEPERTADFKRWSDGIISIATGELRGDRFHPDAVRVIIELNSYLRRIIKRRMKQPADDLISTILAEAPEGGRLTTLEVLMFVQLLLVAGNETTTNLIGNAISALLEHPEQLEQVTNDPTRIAGLIEETLRYDAPIQLLFRTATRDVEIRGVRIPEGATVAPLLGSANRDERQFADPDRFDIGRNARGHLAFGFGQHFCLGSSLARLEAEATLRALVPELERLEPTSSERDLVDSFLVRGPRRLGLKRAA